MESYGEHGKGFLGTTEEKVAVLVADKFKLGSLELNKQPVSFETKTSRLLGNSFLSSYNIFLDNQKKEITLLSRGPRQVVSIERSGFGLELKFENDKKVRISKVDINSPADKAGIEYNDELIAIGGVSYAGDECGLGEWFMSQIDSDTILNVEIKDKGILKLEHGKY